MNRHRHLMVLLLLLAYVGQSLAAVAVPCLTMGSTAGEGGSAANIRMSADMAGMNHAGHTMNADETAQQPGDNSCCDGGLCSMSHCQSVLALPQTHLSGGLVFMPVYHDVAVVSSLHHTLDPLFRPPISR